MKRKSYLVLFFVLALFANAQSKYNLRLQYKSNKELIVPIDSLDYWQFEESGTDGTDDGGGSEEDNSEQEPELTFAENPLYGKTIMFIGDSYVSNKKEPITDTWEYLLAKKNSMTYINRGLNGSCWIGNDTTSTSSFIARLDTITTDAHYIITIGGRNDYNEQVPIEQFREGLVNYIVKLIDKYPGRKHAFFTPWRIENEKFKNDTNAIKQQEYIDTIIEVASEFCIPVFDSSRNGCMYVYSKKFRQKYFQWTTGYGVKYEYSHLNAAGHKYFLNTAEQFIKGL